MKVGHVMSRKIVTVTESTAYQELWEAIFKGHINALPVVDGESRLLGIVTREDLLNPLYPDYKEFIEAISSSEDFAEMEKNIKELTRLKAKNVMSKRVIFTRDTTEVMRALSRMIARNLSQLPVLSHEDKVVGIVTKGDVFYSLFKRYVKTAPLPIPKKRKGRK